MGTVFPPMRTCGGKLLIKHKVLTPSMSRDEAIVSLWSTELDHIVMMS